MYTKDILIRYVSHYVGQKLGATCWSIDDRDNDIDQELADCQSIDSGHLANS